MKCDATIEIAGHVFTCDDVAGHGDWHEGAGTVGGCSFSVRFEPTEPDDSNFFTDQPLTRDKSGTIRFLANPIVGDLLEYCKKHGFGLNEIAVKEYPSWARRQLVQLIGYSFGGYGELSYVNTSAWTRANTAFDVFMQTHPLDDEIPF